MDAVTHGWNERFSGIVRLYGVAAAERIRRAHVAVVGVGGVGSWTAEALARTGVRALTLIDLDDVCISNANRQLHALDGEVGKAKVDVMAERIRRIHPGCDVRPVADFFVAETADTLLTGDFDVVVDAIDNPRHKCLLLARCRERGQAVVTVGAAGGRRDPSLIRTADLAEATHDGLLRRVRRRLRDEHGFPRDGAYGIGAVFSTEAAWYPTADGEVCLEGPKDAALRLDCQSGYGTASFATGAFGLAAASLAIQRIAAGSARGAS